MCVLLRSTAMVVTTLVKCVYMQAHIITIGCDYMLTLSGVLPVAASKCLECFVS